MQDSKKYRCNLPAPEDTSHGAHELLTPGFLRYVGELLFGSKWQTPLAECLSDIRGKDLSPATVHRWTMRSRSIPEWVEGALQTALHQACRDLDRRAETARAVAERLNRSKQINRARENTTQAHPSCR